MQLVRVDVEMAGKVEHNLKGLASADDELIAVVLLGMVLLTILASLWAEQVHGEYDQRQIWKKDEVCSKKWTQKTYKKSGKFYK